MCGIAGQWSSAAPDSIRLAVDAMTNSMIHRGPDDGGSWAIRMTDSTLVLGARRLAIQDLSSAGHQPMCDSRTGNCLVFNGEIYNFKELRRELEIDGTSFDSTSDTEVLLRAYCAWGIGAVAKLSGMFAFAIWDARNDQLILARDRLGVKPLYYAAHDRSLTFASEVRALLASGVPRSMPSPRGLLRYLQ